MRREMLQRLDAEQGVMTRGRRVDDSVIRISELYTQIFAMNI